MRKLAILVAGTMIMSLLVLTPVAVTAKPIVHFEQTIAPGTTLKESLVLGDTDRLTLAWTADGPLKFSLVNPDGSALRHSNGTSGSIIVDIPENGNYTLKWQNPGTSAVAMDFDYGIEPREPPLSVWVYVAIIIALIALIVMIVLAVLYTTKKR